MGFTLLIILLGSASEDKRLIPAVWAGFGKVELGLGLVDLKGE
jgi:hypothetical protein